MNRTPWIAALGIVAVALVAAAPAPAAATRLVATVGPGPTITLTKGGKKVTRLKPGAYAIVVRDRSSAHNFRLRGPGINRATSVARTATVTWTVRLRAGRYVFVCDPHASFMRGAVVVR